MATGRMINKSIGYSRKIATLIDDVGPFGGLFFTWLIPHLDREGRVHGDPDVLKGLVAPRIAGISPEVIRQTAARAHDLGLIVWYEAGGDSYIYFPGFAHNQINLRKDREPESLFPAPTCEPSRHIAGMFPDDCRQTAGTLPAEEKRREEKGKEGKGSEENTMSVCKKTQTDRADDSDAIRKVFDHYRTKGHERAHLDPQPKSREWKNIKARLAEGYSVQDLFDAIDGCHVTPHNQGQNERGQQYLSLDLIVRNGSQVQRFAETWQQRQNGTAPMPSVAVSRQEQGIINALRGVQEHNARIMSGQGNSAGMVSQGNHEDGLSIPGVSTDNGNVRCLVGRAEGSTDDGDI